MTDPTMSDTNVTEAKEPYTDLDAVTAQAVAEHINPPAPPAEGVPAEAIPGAAAAEPVEHEQEQQSWVDPRPAIRAELKTIEAHALFWGGEVGTAIRNGIGRIRDLLEE